MVDHCFADLALFGFFFNVSLYLQLVLGYSPLSTGLAILPVVAALFAGTTVAQRLIRRAGAKPVALGGMTLAAVGLAVLTRVSPDPRSASWRSRASLRPRPPR